MAIEVPRNKKNLQENYSDNDHSLLLNRKQILCNTSFVLFTIALCLWSVFLVHFYKYLPMAPFFRVLCLVAFGISSPGWILLQKTAQTHTIESRKSKICKSRSLEIIIFDALSCFIYEVTDILFIFDIFVIAVNSLSLLRFPMWGVDGFLFV